jgi:predicted peptidase
VNSFRFIPLVLILLVTSPSVLRAQQQKSGSFHARIAKQTTIQYLLYLPQSYSTKNNWPLIVYLHGGSARGDDVNKIRDSGLARRLETEQGFPFVVLSPLCPAGEIWTDADAVFQLIDDVIANHKVDRDRVYLTGHSMGGRGTWYFAFKDPGRFAAIAPMSALSPVTAWSERLRHLPTWVFHGAKDQLAPLAESMELIEALKRQNAPIKASILPEADHAKILENYWNKDLYDWFLEHRRMH